MNRPIYLDYMSTTPVDSRVIKKMQACLEGSFGNPSSQTHAFGWEAAEMIETAKQQVASLIQADPREIIWTSGATESINLAIKGAAHFYHRKGKHIITMKTEHKAVLQSCEYLETQGFEVTYLNPETNGLLDLNKLSEALRPDTLLVSIMYVNNETGVIQDIEAMGSLLKDKGIIFHVDAVQAVGKLPINLQQLNVDLMSFSGHKIYGPKGIGILYVRRTPRVRLEPLIHGGDQQYGIRSGTLPTHQIVGMGEAFFIAQNEMSEDEVRIKSLRDQFWNQISTLDGIYKNGESTIFGCLNIRVDGVESENLILSLRNLAVSNGSACNSAKSVASHVLTAMSLTNEQARSSVRISLGRMTTEEEILYASEYFVEQVKRLRKRPSLWDQAARKVNS